jgi:hypothetical protein
MIYILLLFLPHTLGLTITGQLNNNLDANMYLKKCITDGIFTARSSHIIGPYNSTIIEARSLSREVLNVRCSYRILLYDEKYELNIQMYKDVWGKEYYGISYIPTIYTVIVITPEMIKYFVG